MKIATTMMTMINPVLHRSAWIKVCELDELTGLLNPLKSWDIFAEYVNHSWFTTPTTTYTSEAHIRTLARKYALEYLIESPKAHLFIIKDGRTILWDNGKWLVENSQHCSY